MNDNYQKPLERAKILVLSPSPLDWDEQKSIFQQAGYGLYRPGQEIIADLVIIECRYPAGSRRRIFTEVTKAQKRYPTAALVFLVNPSISSTLREQLYRLGRVCTRSRNPKALLAFCREALRHRALAEEAGERLKSLTNAGALATITQSTQPTNQALMVGGPAPYALEVHSVLIKNGFNVTACLTASQAIKAMEVKQFDIMLCLPQSDSDPVRTLARSMRRRTPGLSAPAITIAKRAEPGLVKCLSPRDIALDLAPQISLALEEEQQRRMLADYLRIYKQQKISDQHTAAASLRFYQRHGARLCARADAISRPLCIVALRLHAPLLTTSPATSIADPMLKASQYLNRIKRCEDLLARIAPSTFVIALPGTLASDAEKIAERITGVLQSVMFEMTDSYSSEKRLFAVQTTTSIAAHQHGGTIEELTATALASLHQQDKTLTRLTPGVLAEERQ